MFPGGVGAETGPDDWREVASPGGMAAFALFWKSKVRLEFGEFVVPVSDHAMGGTLGDAGFSKRGKRPRDPRRGSFVLSYSSNVYVSQSQMPFDFWSSAV